ncbi:hypothetical protein GGR53DRAFT_81663 [Hypoxylon sp. FL1150]|nr:hypothetical protein GGR53DRAFT_81663 [Hypoxylon sp. FL1150]
MLDKIQSFTNEGLQLPILSRKLVRARPSGRLVCFIEHPIYTTPSKPTFIVKVFNSGQWMIIRMKGYDHSTGMLRVSRSSIGEIKHISTYF